LRDVLQEPIEILMRMPIGGDLQDLTQADDIPRFSQLLLPQFDPLGEQPKLLSEGFLG
jgi:hypothetical protein